jgi:hypothetical protein
MKHSYCPQSDHRLQPRQSSMLDDELPALPERIGSNAPMARLTPDTAVRLGRRRFSW